MKKMRTLAALALSLTLLLGVMSACGASSNGSDESIGDIANAVEDYYESDYDYDSGEISDTLTDSSLGGGEGSGIVTADPTEKMIYCADVYAQTLDYDAAVATLRQALAACGGYIESYDESSGGYYYGEYYEGGAHRSASYTLRLPCEEFEGFLGGLAEEFNVIEQTIYSENVTLQYLDLESRISSLTAQQQRLTELLGEAETLEQVLAIEDQLTETRAEIETLTSSLRVLSDRVRYSTITLYIHETTVYSPGAQDGFGARLLRSFASSWENLKDSATDLAFFLACNFLQLLLLAAVVAALWRIAHKRGKLPSLRRKGKHNDKTEGDPNA